MKRRFSETNLPPNENSQDVAYNETESTREESATYDAIDQFCPKSIQESETLKSYCSQIEEFIEKSQKMLDVAYTFDTPRLLKRHLRNRVLELQNIRNQIQTIEDNRKLTNREIEAVNQNINDHKNQLNALKSEERRIKFLLNTENKEKRQNQENKQKTESISMQLSTVSNSIDSNTIGHQSTAEVPTANQSRIFTSSLVRPTRFSKKLKISKTSNGKSSLANEKIKEELPENRISHRNSNGITLFLHSLSESSPAENNQDNSDSLHTSISCASSSVVNVPWNEKNSDLIHSDTDTTSFVSMSNSAIFGSCLWTDVD